MVLTSTFLQISVSHLETMPVMTRKATAQDMELKLRTALQELNASNLKYQQLLQESEESEEEVKRIVLKNTSLKRELAALNQQYLDVVDERDQLQVVTDGFNNCSDLYEEALAKVRDLEDELIHANSRILKLQKEKDCTQVKGTHNLYNELLHSSLITIDLTEDSLLKQNSNYKVSQNKIKKYAKLNKIIRKCNHYRKQQKHFSNNIQLRKERVDLISTLNNYQIKLEDSKRIYEIDTQQLLSEIQALENSLGTLYSKYVGSQNQIKEHILAANESVKCQCTCQTVSILNPVQPEATEDPSQAESPQDSILSEDSTNLAQDLSQILPEIDSFPSCTSHECCNSVMFSDSIGRGLGKLLGNNLSYSIQNYCMPGSTYKHIMASITKNVYNSDTNITVFVGNSSKVKKDDITDCVTELLKLNCNKIILCAFPYFEQLSSSQNNYIYMLNKHVNFLVSHYSDKLVYCDINIFVDKLKSTRNTVYLPFRFRHQIARLLAYNLNSDISSMSKSCIIINTENISNNTNIQGVTLNNCSTSAINIYNNCTKEDPCVTMESEGSTSRRISLPGDGMGVLGLTPNINLN